MSEIENLKIGNGGTLHIVGNEDIIANEWEAGQVYIENRSYVIREHKLLMCNTTHTSVEPFDPDKWTEKNIGEALGTAGSANMIECTLAEYTAWKAGGQLINETVYVITDAPNLNATAQQISYDGGADTVWDKVEELNTNKADATATSGTMTTTIANAGYRATFRMLGNIKFVSFGLTTNTTITTNTTLFTLPENATVNLDAIGHTRTDNFNLYISGNTVKYNTVASLPSGTDMFANFWYV